MINNNENLNQNEEQMENEIDNIEEVSTLTPSEETVNEVPLINYLDPEILKVKTYKQEDLIDNNLEDIQENKDIDLYSNDDFANISEKQLVMGTIVSVNDKEVLVDIGFKSEGVIDKNEFKSVPHVGEEVEVFLVVFED